MDPTGTFTKPSRRQRRICASYLKTTFPHILDYIMSETISFLNQMDIQVQQHSYALLDKNTHMIKRLVVEPIRVRLSFRQLAQTQPILAYAHIGPFLEKYIDLWRSIDPDFYQELYKRHLDHFEYMTEYLHSCTMAYVQKGICEARVEETTELVLRHVLRKIKTQQKSILQ